MNVQIRHLIQGWNDDANQKLKEEIVKLGVLEKDIEFLTERKSRSSVLNKHFNKIPQHYKYVVLYDSDIVLDGSNFIKSLVEDMEKYSEVGAVIIPSYQFAENEIPLKLEPPLSMISSEFYIRDISFLTTFNVIMFRRSVFNKGFRFDEDLWGSQNLDVAAGWDLNRLGFKVIADLRHCLAHKQSDFVGKNLFYHAVVARNRNILREKWIAEDWKGIEHFNRSNSEKTIPSLEELSHFAEDKLIEYICSFDKPGFEQCWLNPRFKDLNSIHAYYNAMINLKNNTSDRYQFYQTDQGCGFKV